MAEIINLNKKRKAKKNALKAKTASANRIKFGKTQAEKKSSEDLLEREKRLFDAHLLESDLDTSQ